MTGPSQRTVVAMMAMLFATIALSIDAMLPALPAIAAELTPGDTNRALLIVSSFFHCYRAMLPSLRERGGGWMVVFASRTAVTGPAQMAAYAAS